MFCSNCGNEFEGKFCPNCGTPAAKINPMESAPEPSPPPSKKEKKALKHKEKKRGGCLKPILIIIAIFVIIGVIITAIGNSPSSNTSTSLTKEMNLTEDQQVAMLNLFAQCGIGEVTSVSTFKEGEDETSYYVEDSETDDYGGVGSTIVVWVNNTTKEVNAIYFDDHDIYIDGQVVGNITNYYVNSTDRGKYRTASEMLVNEVLNYPDSAKYPTKSGWRFSVDGNTVTVQSTVTAKNAFNVEGTEPFQVIFTNGSPTSLILDGTEYLG